MKFKSILIALVVTLGTSLAHANVISNGSPTSPSKRCITGPNSCGGSGTWTVYDQFTTDSAVTVTGFANWNAMTRGVYSVTNWSIWSSTPMANSRLPLASGSSIAAFSITAGHTLASIDGLSVKLAAGSYWLGINHQLLGNGYWEYFASDNGQSNAMQHDGASRAFYDRPDMAFTVTTAVPEPETYAMLLAGLAFVSFAARRKAKLA
ncbi:PEP-CTERM sorting domain-containing protein [Janthinobacterium lividum]